MHFFSESSNGDSTISLVESPIANHVMNCSHPRVTNGNLRPVTTWDQTHHFECDRPLLTSPSLKTERQKRHMKQEQCCMKEKHLKHALGSYELGVGLDHKEGKDGCFSRPG